MILIILLKFILLAMRGGTEKKRKYFKEREGDIMKAEYETNFEILPIKSSPIVITGRIRGMSSVEDEAILKPLKGMKGVCKEVIGGKKFAFCLYKATFKAFLNDTFMYTEHYSAEYDLPPSEILYRLQRKKKLAEEHLTSILSSTDLDKEEIPKVTFSSLFMLDNKKQQEIEKVIVDNEGKIIQNKQSLMDRGLLFSRVKFNIYMYNGNPCITSLCGWKDCHSGIMSFFYTTKGKIPNPRIINMKRLIEEAADSCLNKCNIIDIGVLKEQNKTILKKVLVPAYMFVIPVLIFTIYIGLMSSKNFLGVASAIGIYSVIGAILLWFWKSLSKM